LIIGFDLQALQTEQSRNRGIGRYSENIINKILEIDTTDDLKIFLNGNYKEKINIRENKQSNIIILDYNTPKHDVTNTENQLIQFLTYRKSNLDILHVFSAFEGYPSTLPVITPYLERLNCMLCTTIYDFIPLHYPDHYLSDQKSKTAYYRNLKTVYNSDILFVDSMSARADAINILGINPNKVLYIGGGVSDSFFKMENLSPKEIDKIKKKYGIHEKFILYTGGIDFRKNIERSITAFANIEGSVLSNLSYVIVCQINDFDRKRLTDLAKSNKVEDNVIFTGYIPDEDLNILYNCCEGFVYPSLIEGFGLPVLEAMKCGAPVIGSNSSSIAELIEDESFMFDPLNEQEMTELITKIVADSEFRGKSVVHSLEKSKQFSWYDTTKKILDTYKSLKNNILTKKSKNRIYKPRIAYFSPLPPKKSGIANYSASLLPLLSKYWDIDIFVDDYVCTDPYLATNFGIFSYSEFEQLHKAYPYDSVVYQVGNSENHIYMFDFIKKYPGVVVLHDVYLSGVIYWITGRVGKLNEFIDEVIYSHGEKGKEMVNKAQKNLITWDKLIWELQVNKRLLDNATEIILHSDWDRKNVLKLYPEFTEKISLIHQFAPMRISTDKAKDKASLGFSKNDFLICSFGFVVSTKKIDSIIKNLKSFLEQNQDCRYVIVGEATDVYGQLVKKTIDDLGLNKNVIITGYIDDVTYKKYLNACDVCISLRTNARAGTAASVNHSLGAGLPTIISDEGPFSEFSDDVVIKVKPNEEKNLGKIIGDLYRDQKKLVALGERAREFAQKNLSKDLCVEKYVMAIEKTINCTRMTSK
jgi:glycosyltransferase involved in cell wall biosynthesis